MKRKLFLGVILAIAISACNKEDIATTKESLDRINSVLSITELSSQKTAFSLLSSKEKALLWRRHLNEEIERGSYNKEQVQIIKSALTFTKAEIFEQGSKFWISNNFEIWKVLVSKNFDKHQKATVFGQISAPSVTSVGKITTNSTTEKVVINLIEPSGCECNSGQDFCGDKDWFSCSVIASYHCGATQMCTTSGGTGCGFFWSFSCDGKCFPTYTPGLGC